MQAARANVTPTALRGTVTSANMEWVDAPLADGTYDAFVVWAESRDDDIALDLTITTGAHKGAVVHVRAARVERDPLDLVGLPCTLLVDNSEPRVQW